jgi:hypothetical protein
VHDPSLTPAWDLKTVDVIEASALTLLRTPVSWAGDLNGDGLGDLVLLRPGQILDNLRIHQDFVALLNCGYSGQFLAATFNPEKVAEYNDYESEIFPVERSQGARVLERKGSRVRSVCLYRGKGLRCQISHCNRAPEGCIDLAEWERVETKASK